MAMHNHWRHAALAGCLVATSLASAAPAHAQTAATDFWAGTAEPPKVTAPIIGVITPKSSGWESVSMLNVRSYPLDTAPNSAFKGRWQIFPSSKTIFLSPEGDPMGPLPVGQLIHLEYQPTWQVKPITPGRPPHYHEFWEWGYTLKGDSVLMEPVSPYQISGMLYRKKEGGWLTRPPYSLHGGSWETGGLRNQFPYNLVIFEEGDGHMVNIPESREGPGTYIGRDGVAADGIGRGGIAKVPPGTVGDWRQAKTFTRPWLLDSTRDVDWETDKVVAGRFVKWLDEDVEQGFRSVLVKIPPKWTPPPDYKKTFNEQANVMRYMVWGEMKVWQFKDAQDPGTAYKVSEDYFIYQPPKSIWGFGEGPVTDRGAMWLEVTYAKGFKHGGGTIEKVKQVQ